MEMPMFHIKYRRTTPLIEADVDAPTYEDAVHQLLAAAPADESVEVVGGVTVDTVATEPAKSRK